MNQKAWQEMYEDVEQRLSNAEADIKALTEALTKANHVMGVLIQTENLNPLEVWRECRNALARVGMI